MGFTGLVTALSQLASEIGAHEPKAQPSAVSSGEFAADLETATAEMEAAGIRFSDADFARSLRIPQQVPIEPVMPPSPPPTVRAAAPGLPGKVVTDTGVPVSNPSNVELTAREYGLALIRNDIAKAR